MILKSLNEMPFDQGARHKYFSKNKEDLYTVY